MKKILPWAILALLGMTACQKEISLEPGNGGSNGNANGSEIGTWKFISLAANTEGTVDVSDGSFVLRTVTYANYASEDETGTISFNGSQATSNNIGYSTTLYSNSYFYTDGVLDDSSADQFSLTIPPVSGTSPYQKIGTDSIYFPGGSVMSLQTGNSNPADGSGYKLSWSGDTMFLHMHVHAKYEQTDQGLTQTTDEVAEGIIKLLKQ